MSDSRVRDTLLRDLYVFEDEDNLGTSKRDLIWASTVLDQVFDQMSPERKTLRQILADLRTEITTGGLGAIDFPVTSVNGQTGDVQIDPEMIGLGNVDNTRDIDKPLSDIQRSTIMEILKSYDFNVDLSLLYEHLQDTNNPHGVTLETLMRNGELERYIGDLIARHNLSTKSNIHTDIRRSLSNLWNVVDEYDKKVQGQLEEIVVNLNHHFNDSTAHWELLNGMEMIEHKVQSFFGETDVIDSVHYPSTRAVYEFVNQRYTDLEELIPKTNDWYDDVRVVATRSNLPAPSEREHHTIYFIQIGERSINEVALCRYNTITAQYFWDYTEIGGYSKFNPAHFKDSSDGLMLDTASIVDEILLNGILDTTLKGILSNWISQDHYTTDQIDSFHFISDIAFLPGTMDGTFRFYINDDKDTMSSDIRIAGLQRLAFLEYIREDDIWDNAIQTRHILNKAIVTRHLSDRAVTPAKIECHPGYVIGNLDDRTNTAHEVKMESMVHDNIGTYFNELTKEDVQTMWDAIEV